MFIYFTDLAPSRSSLGTVNGMAQVVASTTRTFAPVVASSLFAISLQFNVLDGTMVYWVLSLFVLAGFIGAFKLPRRLSSDTHLWWNVSSWYRLIFYIFIPCSFFFCRCETCYRCGNRSVVFGVIYMWPCWRVCEYCTLISTSFHFTLAVAISSSKQSHFKPNKALRIIGDITIVGPSGGAHINSLIRRHYVLQYPDSTQYTVCKTSSKYMTRGRSPTPPPFRQVLGPDDDDSNRLSWYWDDDAGGFIIAFGKYAKAEPQLHIHDLSMSYLEFVREKCPYKVRA